MPSGVVEDQKLLINCHVETQATLLRTHNLVANLHLVSYAQFHVLDTKSEPPSFDQTLARPTSRRGMDTEGFFPGCSQFFPESLHLCIHSGISLVMWTPHLLLHLLVEFIFVCPIYWVNWMVIFRRRWAIL